MPPQSRLQIDLSRLPEASNPLFYPLFFNQSRYLVLMGGAGSGKSVFAAHKVLVRCIWDKAPHRFVALRKIARTARESVFHELQRAISAWNWGAQWHVHKQEMRLTFVPNGSEIIIGGLDDQEKIKSFSGATSFWLEEATEFTPEDIDQLDLRLRGDTGHYHQFIYSFNPISVNHHLKARFWDCDPDSDVTICHSTFLDNRFLNPQARKVLLNLKAKNPSWWKIYGEGQWGIMEGLIYDPPIIGPWPGAFHETFYGLDFGYNHPTALTQVDMKDGAPYITELLYESELTTSALISRLRGEDNEPAKPLIARRSLPIYADSAEPGMIAEICKAGFNCLPADKGQGSVHAGISFCQGLRIHSKSANTNLNAEFGSYVWAKDKNGKSLDEPVKAKDDGLDSMRYALWTHLGKRERVPAPFSRKLIGA